MSKRFYNNDLQYIADTNKSIFRINRDIRFSKNKNPYKDNLGVFFPYSLSQTIDKKPESIGLYIHYERSGCFIFGGVHLPKPEPLKAIRTRLLDDYDLFEEILHDKKLKNEFPGGLIGKTLTKIPRGFPKEHPAEKYIKMKEFGVMSQISMKDFFSPKLPSIMIKKGIALNSFVEFLLEAVS